EQEERRVVEELEELQREHMQGKIEKRCNQYFGVEEGWKEKQENQASQEEQENQAKQEKQSK
ncbi:hypothetical protein KI387_034914, partial [Taxus chinensis]